MKKKHLRSLIESLDFSVERSLTFLLEAEDMNLSLELKIEEYYSLQADITKAKKELEVLLKPKELRATRMYEEIRGQMKEMNVAEVKVGKIVATLQAITKKIVPSYKELWEAGLTKVNNKIRASLELLQAQQLEAKKAAAEAKRDYEVAFHLTNEASVWMQKILGTMRTLGRKVIFLARGLSDDADELRALLQRTKQELQ